MFIVREIFQLKFGHYRPAKKLLDEAMEKNMMPDAAFSNVYTDFTGAGYRLIFTEGYNTLGEFENSLARGMEKPEWQEWYGRFKEHVVSSEREILKKIM